VVAFGQLLQIQESRQPFDVITSLETYKNMWIKGLSIPRDANTGQVLIFNLSLVQLIIAQPQSVNLQVFKDPNLGPGEVNKGKQELLTSGSAQGAKAGLNDVNKLLGKFNSLAGGTN
jgi:hypothetical protein